MCGHIVVLVLGAGVSAAPDPNEKGNYVSRQEYEALKKELDDVKARLSAPQKAPQSQEQTQPEIERLNKEVARVRQMAEGSGLGDTKLLITGSAAAGYFDPEGQSSTFAAEFNPMLLWQLNERLFFEGELELALEGPDVGGEGSETEAELDLAYLTYLFNDYALGGAGKFSVPFTVYHNHLDPSWLNKLPTDPLVYGDGGIAPDTGIGAFVTGAVPCHRALFNYAVFLTNGPALITEDPESAGSLNFDNFNDLNNNKALGFRLGYLPIPQLEVGYSFEFSRPNPPGFETVRSQLHGVDLNYVAHLDAIKGQLTGRGAWVWSNLDEATYDPTGGLGFGPLRFDNDRNGGYAEVAYRPTEAPERFLRNFEFVLRYDRLDIPSGAPGGGTIDQWTPGIDYWLTPRTVLKAAYTFDDSNEDNYTNAFPIMQKYGFTGVEYVVVQYINEPHYLTVPQIKEMAAAGWEIGSHSETHRDLITSTDTLRYEIVQSRKDLQDRLGLPILTFAYPFGAEDSAAGDYVHFAGYVAAMGATGYSWDQGKGNLFVLQRCEIKGSDDVKSITRFLPWLGDPSFLPTDTPTVTPLPTRTLIPTYTQYPTRTPSPPATP